MSSSTHPHGIVPERGSLRGLLQTNGNTVYIQTAPGQYQAVQQTFSVQQYQNRFPNQQLQLRQQQHQQQQQQQQQRILLPAQQHHQQQQPRAGGIHMRPGFQSPPLQQSSSAKWHIPQQQGSDNPNNANNMGNRSNLMPSINDSFKITLKSQTQDGKNLPATVTSTIPKTPSPNHVLQGKSESEHNLDKYCEASVNDLMATIAKLDSNGVQVLAEGRSKTGGSPHVDSSTDDSVAGVYIRFFDIYTF